MDVPLPPLLELAPALGLGFSSANGTTARAEEGDSMGEGYAAAEAVVVPDWGVCASTRAGMADEVPAGACLNDGSQGGRTSSKVCGGVSRGPNSGTHAIS